MSLTIAKLLRYGVLIAGALMLAGWCTLLDFSHNPLAAFHEYQSSNLEQSLRIALEAGQWGLLLAYLGLAVLISLPLLRVFLTALLFLKQKEKAMAILSFFVLAVLILSFSLGIEL